MTRYNFGIPDIELASPKGGTVNPSVFAGHALVLVFCPTTAAAEASETAEYMRRACEFANFDAWLLTVCERSSSEPDAACPTTVAHDPDGRAWAIFCELAAPLVELDRDAGATFLFDRGGSLRRVWRGPGHCEDVLDALADGTARSRLTSNPMGSAISA